MARQRIRCSCGAELPRPIPRRCPQCQATLTQVVRRGSQLQAVLTIAGMFAVLAGFVAWLLART